MPPEQLRISQKTHISVPASLAWSVLAFVVLVSVGGATMLQSIRSDLDFIKYRLTILEAFAGGPKP